MNITSDASWELTGGCYQLNTVIPLWIKQIIASYEEDHEVK